MLGLKSRVGLLGLLALLLIGSYAAASAEAQGPFWYHRANSTEGKGLKLSGQEPEEVRGGGGEAVLEGKIGGAEVVLAASQVQIKGVVYNNGMQGQAKLNFAYFNPHSVKPNNCNVRIGSNNVVKVYGHQAWTYNGEPKQLTEQPIVSQKPEWIFLGQELPQGEKELSKEAVFTTVTLLSGGTCAIPGTAQVKGSAGASIKPENTGEFSLKQTAESLENGSLQHFWNGSSNIAATLNLTMNNEPAKLKQSGTVSTFGRQGNAAQEVALFEN